MANDNSPIIIPLTADVSDLLKDLAKIGKEAAKAEGDIDSLLAKLKQLSSVGGSTITLTVSADTSQAENRIKNLDSSATDVDILVNADTVKAETDISNVGDSAPSPVIETTADITTAESDIKSLSDSAIKAEVQVTADTSDADKKLKDIDDKLGNLQKLAVIDLVLNSGGAIATATQFINDFPIVSTLSDTAAAMREVEAQTGKTFTGLDRIINNVFTDGLAESRGVVGNVIAQLARAGVATEDLEASTRNAFNTAAVTGEDVNTILDTQLRLVKSGLSDSYVDAGDTITHAFQTGGSSAGDLLDAVIEFSGQFVQAGINADQAFAILNAGAEAGVYDVSQVGESLIEMNANVASALAEGSGDTFDVLERLGLTDTAKAYEAGELTGAEFAAATLKAIETKGTDADLPSIFGSAVENIGFDIFKNIDFAAAAQPIASIGSAQAGADTLTDTLPQSVEELAKTVETRLAESFKIAGMSLSEVLDGAKEKVQEITDLLKSGKGLPEALEIALDAPGLAKEIQRFEASIGNFIIELMLAIADAQQALGLGDKGANLRVRAADAAETQFAYDIKVANPDEISGLVRTAIDRGVNTADVSAAFTTSTNELIARGDVDRAQELLFAVNELPNALLQVSTTRLGAEGVVDIPFAFDPEATAEEIQKAKEAAVLLYEQSTGENVISIGDQVKIAPLIDTTAAHTAIDDAFTKIDAGMQKFQNLGSVFTNPLEGIMSAFNTPGGQELAMGAGAESLAAAASQFGAGSMVDWSELGNAILPPVVVEEATQAATDISTATTAMAGTATTDFETVQLAATDAAVELDTVVVASENLEVIGGQKIMAFAALANQAAQIATSGWQNFNATIASAQNAAGAGIPASDGSLGGAMDWLTATVDSLEGKAGGGQVTADTPYVVGEQGQEIFVPSSDGSIIDANNTAMIMEALGMIAGMQPGNTSNVVNNNWHMGGINSTFNTTNQAQGVSASAALARQIRSMR